MKARATCIALLVAAVSAAQAESLTPDKLLAQMRNAYAKVRSATFATKAKVFDEKTQKMRVVRSETEFLAPGYASIKVPGAKSLNGEPIGILHNSADLILLGLPSERRHRAYSVGEVTRTVPMNLESLCFWDYARQLSADKKGLMHGNKLSVQKPEKWKGKQYLVLQEVADTVKAKYYVDPKTKLIWRTVWIYLPDKSLLQDCSLEWLNLNSEVNAKQFQRVNASSHVAIQ